jgi:hypothetical protein
MGELKVKQLDVRFGSGQEVLTAYWGFLSDGGLVIPDRGELNLGQLVRLRVHIASSETDCDLGGKVVRLHQRDQQAIVAFDPGEPHDMLLTAALAETDDVPARAYQRHAVALPVEASGSSGDATGRLVDLSCGGCCVRLDDAAELFAVGEDIGVTTQEFRATGTVVWAHGQDRGVSFDDAGRAAATTFVDTL